jgi:hypothetical protein
MRIGFERYYLGESNNLFSPNGSSRDWMGIDIPCKASQCINNNGHGDCVLPSLIQIDNTGKCVMVDKLTKKTA